MAKKASKQVILLSSFEHAVPDSITQEEIIGATRSNKLGDGFCCWLDHMYGNMKSRSRKPANPLF